jgi:hypothetical protein
MTYLMIPHRPASDKNAQSCGELHWMRPCTWLEGVGIVSSFGFVKNHPKKLTLPFDSITRLSIPLENLTQAAFDSREFI